MIGWFGVGAGLITGVGKLKAAVDGLGKQSDGVGASTALEYWKSDGLGASAEM